MQRGGGEGDQEVVLLRVFPLTDSALPPSEVSTRSLGAVWVLLYLPVHLHLPPPSSISSIWPTKFQGLSLEVLLLSVEFYKNCQLKGPFSFQITQ